MNSPAPSLFILTGGSRGLGQALLAQYRAANWQVLELSRSGQGEWHLPLDLQHFSAAAPRIEQRFAELAAQSWSDIVFINNAARIEPIGPLVSLTDEDIAANLEVNFSAGIRCIALFARSFAASPTRKLIASISSGAAHRPYASWSLYCAAKAGLEHFLRTLAEEQVGLRHPYICININPGVMDTTMQAAIRDTPPEHFPLLERFLELHRGGALKAPTEVAAAIRRIIADAPRNGESYNVV